MDKKKLVQSAREIANKENIPLTSGGKASGRKPQPKTPNEGRAASAGRNIADQLHGKK